MAEESFWYRFQRFLHVYVFAVPCVVLFAPVFKLYDFITLTSLGGLRNNPTNHARKVKDVQDQVKEWNRQGRKEGKLMCTARKTWKKMGLHSYDKSKYTQISMDMNDIVEIDTVNEVLTVEPGMMMKRLTSILLPMGWTIPVVPEFDTLTVGGCVCGAGLETSSHKYSLFAVSCVEYEVVLSDGSLVTCNKDEHSELHYAMMMSYGTLGFLTAVKIRLMRATKYVRLEYMPLESVEQTMDLMQDTRQDFVEGIVYGPGRIVVCFANMVSDAEVNRRKINSINQWYKPWYYKHMESFLHKPPLSKDRRHEEYVTLCDYYHRHTRSYFWEAAINFPYGNHPLFRYLFGWIFPINYHLSRLLSVKSMWEILFVKNHVLQDFVLPIEKLPAAIKYIQDLVEVYPLWLCPVKVVSLPGLSPLASNFYVDIGVYGDPPKSRNFDHVETTRQMEQYVIEHKGFQGLYADTFMSHEDYKKMFETDLYDKVRAKYNCSDAFPHVYDKVSASARRRLAQEGR